MGKYKKLIIIVTIVLATLGILAYIISGVFNKKDTSTNELNDSSNVNIDNSNDKTPYSNTDNSIYANDNAGDYNKNSYSSDISIDESKLNDKYNYTGTNYVYQKTEYINDEEVSKEKIIKELEDKLYTYVDKDTGEYIINCINNETEEEALNRITNEVLQINNQITQLEEDNKQIDISIEQYIYAIQKVVVNDIYYNGIVLLNNTNNKEDFESKHIISADYAIKQFKANLESIEYCDTILNNNLILTEEEINNWYKIKTILISVRTKLYDINTYEDYSKAKITFDDSISELITNLNITLNKYEIS